MSPTQRTLAECRRRGWIACVVEKWLAPARRRVDAFGFGDILAVNPTEDGAVLIQCTTTSNAPARVRKILTECAEEALAWIRAGNTILTWGWSKRGKRGLWTLKEYPVTEDMFH